MTYRLLITLVAEMDIRALNTTARRRVRSRIKQLREDPYKNTSKIGIGLFRVRVGDYRILYEIDDRQRVVRVTHVRHRREAYR